MLKRGLATERDSLSFTWDVRYVHEFYRGWESIGLGGLVVGLVWWGLAMALVLYLLPTVRWAQAVLGALIGLAWMWRLLRRRLQGFTGDGLGATQQVCELLFYLALAFSLPAVAP